MYSDNTIKGLQGSAGQNLTLHSAYTSLYTYTFMEETTAK